MSGNENYVVVESDVLPDVYRKVLEAKTILASGRAKSSTEACKMVSISRGAFYKYKDKIFSYQEKVNHNYITFHFVLVDEPGILSSVLSQFYEKGANILTVNQNIPNDHVAVATISIRLKDESVNMDSFIQSLKKLTGVIDVKII